MVFTKIKQTYSDMFQAEKKVADYILDHPEDVLDMNISDLAKASNTSDATIIRMCKHIGYTGFYQLKISLASSVNDANGKKEIDKPEDIVEYFEKVASMLTSVVKNINMDALAASVKLISKAGTVYTTGWGNTNEIASDLAHRLTRGGIRSFNSDIPEYIIRSLGLGDEQDVLVAISHSGEALHAVSYTHLDVYKRQAVSHGGGADHGGDRLGGDAVYHHYRQGHPGENAAEGSVPDAGPGGD